MGISKSYRSSFNSNHKYNISCKVSLYTHGLLQEIANQECQGVISEVLRKALEFYIDAKDQDSAKSLSTKFRLARERYLASQREQDIEQLKIDYGRLLKYPNPVFEAICKVRASELGMEWPPADVKKWEIDKDLHRTMKAIERCANGSGVTSLREVCRALGEHVVDVDPCVRELHELGMVRYESSKEIVIQKN